ncbi:hypothetical protein HHX47_DHR7000369 [Lentinula edodes]|nr:hypothetical protein HHX47_DHR7000369 [Lentinula edodes]
MNHLCYDKDMDPLDYYTVLIWSFNFLSIVTVSILGLSQTQQALAFIECSVLNYALTLNSKALLKTTVRTYDQHHCRHGCAALRWASTVTFDDAANWNLHIADDSLEGVDEPNGSETAASVCEAHTALLRRFIFCLLIREPILKPRLGHLLDKLIEEGGIHRLGNLLSLIQPLHQTFDNLNLWFDGTDEGST